MASVPDSKAPANANVAPIDPVEEKRPASKCPWKAAQQATKNAAAYFGYSSYDGFSKDMERLLSDSIKEAGAGIVGSIFSSIFTFPIEVVKTRMQVPRSPYTDMGNAFTTILREEGLLTFYRGFDSEIIKTSIQSGVYFFFYHPLKQLSLRKRDEQLSMGKNLLVGWISGCVAQFVVNPLSLVQTRMMTRKKTGRASDSMIGMFAKIIREEGVLTLWDGILPSIILSTNPSIQNFVFDRLKAWWTKRLQQRETPRHPSAFELFLMGAIAKIVATIITYPYIMAKVRLQWKQSKADTAGRIQYSGSLDVIRKTLMHEGFLGLYAGLQPQLVKSVLGTAIMYMAKEKVQEYSDALLRVAMALLRKRPAA